MVSETHLSLGTQSGIILFVVMSVETSEGCNQLHNTSQAHTHPFAAVSNIIIIRNNHKSLDSLEDFIILFPLTMGN